MTISPYDEDEIFHQALEMSDLAERELWLRRACGKDTRLRAAVNQLLTDHVTATAFFTNAETALTCPPEFLDGSSSFETNSRNGTIVGPYRLLRRLGEGGSGIVYEAEQTSPVRRKVALKILKLGADTERVIARFEQERQTLALMEHPNIARVLDAGTTGGGRPYFVMELVHGTKITDYCAQNVLPLRQRLGIFKQACTAVQHAHQKSIIHRDLKPSNILVTAIDGHPVPKVIDFGIAKAVTDPSDEGAAVTLQHQPLGTPAYMSPEQLQGVADIDTRADVYSLGVVLYELLVGRPPFDNDELLSTGFDGMRRRICHEEPFRPSQQLEALPKPAVASELPWRASNLRGDLDCIVLKALEKDRECRYATIRDFAADIERWLKDEPIHARRTSRWYRLSKLVRRHRLTSAAITVAVLALAAGFTTSTWLFFKARSAERQQTRLRAEAEEREHIAKAAIYLLRGRQEDADAEIEKVGGMLTQPSVEATNVFGQLSRWSACRGDWKKAAQRLLALSRVNRFDDSDLTDNATRDLLPIAPTLLSIDYRPAYEDFMRLLLDRLGRTRNPIAAEHVLKSRLLAPSNPAALASLIHVAAIAENSLVSRPHEPANQSEAWRCAVLGLWYLRRGENDAALRWCDRTLTFHQEDRAVEAYARLVRAMAGNCVEPTSPQTRQDLTVAQQLLATYFQPPYEVNRAGLWYDWLGVRLLMQEADAALALTQARSGS